MTPNHPWPTFSFRLLAAALVMAALAVGLLVTTVPAPEAEAQSRPTITSIRTIDSYVIEAAFSEAMRGRQPGEGVTIHVNGIEYPTTIVRTKCRKQGLDAPCRWPLDHRYLWVHLLWPIFNGDTVKFSYSREDAVDKLLSHRNRHMESVYKLAVTNNRTATKPTIMLGAVGRSILEGLEIRWNIISTANEAAWPEGAKTVTGGAGSWPIALQDVGVPIMLSRLSTEYTPKNRIWRHRLTRANRTSPGRWTIRYRTPGDSSQYGPLNIGLHNGVGYTTAAPTSLCITVQSATDSYDSCPSTQVVGEPLTFEFEGVPTTHNGTPFDFQIEFSEAVWATAAQVQSAVGATNATVTAASRKSSTDTVWDVTVAPSGTDMVTLSLGVPENCDDEGAICTGDGRKLSNAVAQQVAFAHWLSVADAQATEGDNANMDFTATLTPAKSETVTVQYVTQEGTATAGSDYTSTSGTLTFGANETQKTVSVPIGDDEVVEIGGETLVLALSGPTGAVLARDQATGTILDAVVPLTASFHDVPASHAGSTTFTFGLRFSENLAGLSYVTLRDDAFDVSRGEVVNAKRKTEGQNQNWTIHIEPDGTGPVVISLPAAAVSTTDGRLLESEVTATVSGNRPATGAPTIGGKVRVGETLTVNTTGITDPDGLEGVSYSYAWSADNSLIPDATGASLELTSDHEGKAIGVRVTFTDNGGYEETLASAETGAVAARDAEAGLSLSDFDAGDGQDVLASALIRVGNRGRKSNEDQDRAWYATETSGWHASGALRDGSLTWNGMALTRVLYLSGSSEFRFNQSSDIHIGDSFAPGGANREATIWIQTGAETVSFVAKNHIRNSGSGWITFNVPTSIRPVLGGVSEDELVIVAVSTPAGS